MDVYITCTPDFSDKTLDNVISTLNSSQGPINFHSSEISDKELFNDHLEGFNDKSNLTNNEFFQVCEKYRRSNKIAKDAYFVLISDKRHSDNWFSAFREKNIFIIGSEWKSFTKKDYKYPIAFQVVECLFQTLCNLKIEEKIGNDWVGLPFDKIDPNIHIERTTCVNGMCEYKSWISDKFIAGYICDSCYERAEQEIEDSLILNHIEGLLKYLRDEFTRRGNNPERAFLPIKVDENGEIRVGSQIIEMNAQRTAFYVYFLSSRDGIKTDTIGTKENVLGVYGYYKSLDKISADLGVIAGPLGWLPQIKINQLDSSDDFFDKKLSKANFERVRTEIKKSLKKVIGPAILKYYMIDNVKIEGNRLYKVELSHDKKKINLIPSEL